MVQLSTKQMDKLMKINYYMPSDYDIYKAFLLRFIESDRKTKYTTLGFEHVSPFFQEFDKLGKRSK